jgi:hypothetical protein
MNKQGVDLDEFNLNGEQTSVTPQNDATMAQLNKTSIIMKRQTRIKQFDRTGRPFENKYDDQDGFDAKRFRFYNIINHLKLFLAALTLIMTNYHRRKLSANRLSLILRKYKVHHASHEV